VPNALIQRLESLRLEGAAVLVAAVAMAGCAPTSTIVPAPTVPVPFFALRLAFNDSASGRERFHYGDATVFLGPEVLLADEDLLGVNIVTRPDGRLLLHVRHRPAERLSNATAKHAGAQVAVLLDSRVWSLAPIAGPIGAGGSMVIATSATGEDAERIAQQVRSRWPAR